MSFFTSRFLYIIKPAWSSYSYPKLALSVKLKSTLMKYFDFKLIPRIIRLPETVFQTWVQYFTHNLNFKAVSFQKLLRKIPRIGGIKLCLFTEHTKIILNLTISVNSKTKLKIVQLVTWQLRLVLFAKPVENKKIS